MVRATSISTGAFVFKFLSVLICALKIKLSSRYLGSGNSTCDSSNVAVGGNQEALGGGNSLEQFIQPRAERSCVSLAKECYYAPRVTLINSVVNGNNVKLSTPVPRSNISHISVPFHANFGIYQEDETTVFVFFIVSF